jgi:hypothetical protein
MRLSLFLLLWSLVLGQAAPVSDLKRDQELVLFPTMARRATDNKGWDLEIHGCIYEPEKNRLALLLLRQTLQLRGIRLTPAENALLGQRARLFMVDHERGKRIVLRVGKKTVKLNQSGPDGQVAGTVHLKDKEMQESGPVLAVHAILSSRDTRVFAGRVSLLEDAGTMVISDIDDTIKITNVRNPGATLRNTFLEAFRPVPGMAEVYQSWARGDKADFCYVSASPWQLFLPLADFVRSNGFPAGPFYLKQFRWKDESLFNLFESPEKYKPQVIEPLLAKFPNRRFVLVGDSGERDPEIYGALARQYPKQVKRILIRDVTGESPEAERYRAAFQGIAQECWRVFREPSEIAEALP